MYNDVVNFIQACDQERTLENSHLYLKLITEEYDELMNSKERTEELYACIDLIWVILGYCYMRGYNVDGAWGEVSNSNLSKINPNTGKVTKRDDGKVLKPEGWKPPELKDFV
jgi:predicted HAD superfamily Cof-like phosphohydrolase